jgi:hypothetical protein
MPAASTWKSAAISPRNEPIFDRGGPNVGFVPIDPARLRRIDG